MRKTHSQKKNNQQENRNVTTSATCIHNITSEDVANSICSKDFVLFVFGRLLIYLQSFVIQTAIYSQVGTLFELDCRVAVSQAHNAYC